MTTQTIENANDPVCACSGQMRDLLVVLSFGLWAVLLGLVPALAFRLVMGG
jgi:hypothetical protein